MLLKTIPSTFALAFVLLMSSELDSIRALSGPGKGCRILNSGTLTRLAPEVEFEFPLWALIDAAKTEPSSEELLDYLFGQGGKRIDYSQTPEHLRFQISYYTDKLIRDRQFTVRSIISSGEFGSFQILAENENFHYAYALDDGTIFYREEKRGLHLGCGLVAVELFPEPRFEKRIAGLRLCEKFGLTRPSLIELADPALQAQPDLSLDFLRELAKPAQLSF